MCVLVTQAHSKGVDFWGLWGFTMTVLAHKGPCVRVHAVCLPLRAMLGLMSAMAGGEAVCAALRLIARWHALLASAFVQSCCFLGHTSQGVCQVPDVAALDRGCTRRLAPPTSLESGAAVIPSAVSLTDTAAGGWEGIAAANSVILLWLCAQ